MAWEGGDFLALAAYLDAGMLQLDRICSRPIAILSMTYPNTMDQNMNMESGGGKAG